MIKNSFLKFDTPPLVSMVQATSPERICELVDLSRTEGAEAVGMQFCRMKAEYKSRECYTELFGYASPLPVYVTNYRDGENAGKSDQQLATELIELADCGATLCDVMGDLFAPTEGQLTMNEAAVAEQIKLIDTLHALGSEVIMSSHVLKFTPAERALEIALEHQRRGADISKIVTFANNRAEEIENLRIIDILKKELKIPFLFLAGGECKILRRLGGALGSCMSLCVYEHDALSTKSQPLLCDMKKIRNLI